MVPSPARGADAPFLDRLRRQESEAEALRVALTLTLEHFHAESGTIHVLRGDTLELRAHSPGMPPPVLDIIRAVPVGKGMAGLALQRNEPVTACNLQTDASGDVRPGARATGLRGSIVVPLAGANGPVGTLGIANREERVFAPDEVALLLTVGSVLGGWVERAATRS